MKTKIKITIAIIITILGIALYNNHQNQQRAEYAKTHNCTWVIQGSHDICK